MNVSVRKRLVLVGIVATRLTLPELSYSAEKKAEKRKSPATVDKALLIPEDPICNFDFMNYKYPISDHTLKTTGVPPEVVLRNGAASLVSATGKNVDMGITKIIYGELTRDNAYEAVVRMSTIVVGSEYGTDDLYVFRYVSSTPVLLGIISEYDMDSAFLKYFPGGVLSHGLTGIKIHGRTLEVEKNVETAVNEPKYNVRITYRYGNGKLSVSGMPVKVPYRPFP